jgi:uncharacterized protein (DUF849 family)
MKAGASMLHLHVRDDAALHTLDSGRYRRAMEAVRARCGDELLIQATTESAGVYSHANQVAAIRSIDADFLSLALVEIAGSQAPTELEAARQLFQHLDDRKVAIQFILYQPEDFEILDYLRKEDILSMNHYSLLFVLGRFRRGRESVPEDLLPFLARVSNNRPWMVCAFGRSERECMSFAAAHGGHARVGFENNMFRPDGKWLQSNAESVELLVHELRREQLDIASTGYARELLLYPADA